MTRNRLLTFALLAVIAVPIIWLGDILSTAYMPRGHCVQWDASIVWPSFFGDAATALAYYTIPIALFIGWRRRRDVQLSWILLAFAIFITACGTVHLVDTWMYWDPTYRLSTAVKVTTGVISIVVAILIWWKVLPAVAAVPTASDLSAANAQLAASNTALSAANTALEHSNTTLADFAYVASHDLKSPLRAVSTYLALIERDDEAATLPANAKRFIDRARMAAQRMDTLVDDLLDYGSVGHGDEARAPVSLDEVLSTVLEDLEDTLAETGAVVRREGAPLPTIQGRPSEVERLLTNLISNAVKYTVPGTTADVVVSARSQDDGVVLMVRDNGIGIAPEHHAAIFQMFKRLHGREEYAGTGIGLASCERVMQGHRGRIWVESALGEGATFFAHFPPMTPVDDARAVASGA